MRIGELAKSSGVPVGTIRFYERRKLLKSPLRAASGYRVYDPREVQVVKGIRKMQELGFTLREIKGLLELHRYASCVPVKSAGPDNLLGMIAMTKEKLQLIETKSKSLRLMRKEVAQMLHNLQTSAELACPVARELAQPQCPRKSR